MNKSNKLEIIGVLAISFLITSSFAVSSCLPEMMKTFSEYSRAEMEMLMSSPSFTMLLMIALTPILSPYLSERFMVITGLLTFGIAGLVPVFIESYPIIFAARIFMGLGIGLLNAKAVSMIGERFTGDLRSKLQGIRCSMETLGQSALMMVVGLLLPFGWNYTFLVFSSAFVVLIMYLAFVPVRKKTNADIAEDSATAKPASGTYRLTSNDILVIAKNLFLGLSLVSSQMIMSIRLTSYIVENGIGTSVDGANILSISVFFGFIGGIFFGRLMQLFRQRLLPLTLLCIGGSLACIGFSGSLTMILIGACLANFFLTIGLSFMFNGLSDQVPVEALNTANSMVLVGCNLGASITPFILTLISMINPELSTCYILYAAVYAVFAVPLLVRTRKNA
ncbi:MAG: MFS transporter [Lachnoclostridium sp.]|nr:MFS transporter [Lachnoclostridium sp.]